MVGSAAATSIQQIFVHHLNSTDPEEVLFDAVMPWRRYVLHT
jgi:hypothetical protein